MRFTVETNKKPETVLEIIRENTKERTSRFGFFVPDEYFSGQVTETGFKIYRNIHYRNSFLPVIIGTVEATSTGSTVHIEMRLQAYVLFFIIGVLSCIGFAFIKDPTYFLIPVVFVSAFMIILYKIETHIARKKLEELLC